jgi:phosphoglycerate kinase
MKTIYQLENIEGQRVFLRADLNVSIVDGTITDDFRLESIIPTLQKLKEMKPSKIILATHIGSPIEKDENLSTKHLVSWFEKKGFSITFAENVSIATEASLHSDDSIVLLENLRFFPGETIDSKKKDFSEELFALADFYINDAFGSLHRDNASIATLPTLFSEDKIAIGPLIEKEVLALKILKEKLEQPFVLIAGGNKLSTKLSMLKTLMNSSKKHRPDSILVGGRLAHAFLRAEGDHNPLFDVSAEDIEIARGIIDLAAKQKISLTIPTDHIVADVDQIKRAVDIGMNTVQQFTEEISTAKTFFLNGPIGMYEHPEGTFGTDKICHAIAQSSATLKIVGGGDTISAIRQYKLESNFTLLSTGGGSLLAFLALENPEQDLPGLAALSR